MTKIEDTKYLRISYFQKSKLLFALIAGNNYNGEDKNKVINTYLFSTEIDENILDYYLLAEFGKDVELDETLLKNLYTTYSTENNTDLYIFDISCYKDDIDKFLIGEYSQFSEEAKKEILNYYGYYDKNKQGKIVVDSNVHKIGGMLHIYTFLYPQECKEYIAEDMANSLFGTKQEALQTLNYMKEVCPAYDMQKETIKTKLI